jgi:hypothetical protein
MTDKRSGHCLCGAISYEVAWPPAAVMACHCKDCQRQAGTVLSVIAAVPLDSVSVTGSLKTYVSHGETGGEVLRRFCGDCGSPIMSEIPREPFMGMAYLKAGTLDNTDDLAPSAHLWTSSAQHWFPFPEGCVKIDKQG